MTNSEKQIFADKLEDAKAAIFGDNPMEASLIINDVYDGLREPYNQMIINDLRFFNQAE